MKIGKVEEQLPAPLDEAFAKSFGIGDGSLDSLRREVRANMERELNEAIRQKMRAQILEGLYAQNPLELPRQLVDEQIQELQAEMLRRAGIRDAKQLPPREPFEQPARRRVALGLLMSELVRNAALKVNRETVQQKINELASSYSNPEEVRRAYLQNPEMMRQIESQALEQAIDWVLGQARVNEKPSSFSEIITSGRSRPDRRADERHRVSDERRALNLIPIVASRPPAANVYDIYSRLLRSGSCSPSVGRGPGERHRGAAPVPRMKIGQRHRCTSIPRGSVSQTRHLHTMQFVKPDVSTICGRRQPQWAPAAGGWRPGQAIHAAELPSDDSPAVGRFLGPGR